MILSRVVGNSVSTVQHPAYDGWAVMVCVPVDTDGHTPIGGEFLSLDSVQAGVGDLVLCSREGNTARDILGSSEDPFHSVIVGIVDSVDV